MTLGTMFYHDVPQSQPGANLKYVGDVATGYDAKREESPKWKAEQQIIEGMLSDLPRGAWVLDAPCGTGRFMQACADRDLIYRGLDISEDMIHQAMAKIGGQSPMARVTTDKGIVEFPQFMFQKGNVTEPGLPDKSIDAVLNIRITRWLSPQECQQMFKEMQRIARDRIIVTARVTYPNTPKRSAIDLAKLARPLHLFEAVMADDWVLERSEAGYVPEYRIFQFRNKRSPFLAQKNIIIDTVKAADEAGGDQWTMKPYEAS